MTNSFRRAFHHFQYCHFFENYGFSVSFPILFTRNILNTLDETARSETLRSLLRLYARHHINDTCRRKRTLRYRPRPGIAYEQVSNESIIHRNVIMTRAVYYYHCNLFPRLAIRQHVTSAELHVIHYERQIYTPADRSVWQ